MTEAEKILNDVASGSMSVNDALLKLKLRPFADIGYAKPDFHRQIRQGCSEVIYGAGKTTDQIIGICRAMMKEGCGRILITRISKDSAELIRKEIDMQYFADARMGICGGFPDERVGKIVIATGGTSDIPVAEEAAVTAKFLGNNVVRLYDVGVSGIHRLLSYSDEIMQANAVVAIAGMEGALASVIGGLSDCPVIAVPTSVGYGASFGGLAALLSMLNSCASGVSVVNIDNGFGAAYQASMINKASCKS